jgi:hypothetical protein
MLGISFSELALIGFVFFLLLNQNQKSEESQKLLKFFVKARRRARSFRFQMIDLQRKSNLFLAEQEKKFEKLENTTQDEDRFDKKS